MNFSCKSESLKQSIACVEKAVSQKSTLPVLENIFLELKGSKLVLRGNNLEIGIETDCPIDNGDDSGQVLVKAKTLSSIVSRIDDVDIDVSVDDTQKLSIKGNKVNFDILGSDAMDYPVFPSVDDGITFQLPVAKLNDLIKHTIIAVSYDETKQFLTGIFLTSKDDVLSCVATDGYRLALKQHGIPPLSEPLEAIIPYKAVNELGRLLQTKDASAQVSITLSKNQIAFKLGSLLLVSRLIQGQFPDYKQVIPESVTHSFKLKKAAFQAAAERAALIAVASNNVVRFSFKDDVVSLFSNAKGFGGFNEDIQSERLSGDEEMKIAFNIRLMLDVLKMVNSDTVCLSFNNELSPCKVTVEGDDSFTYIIMPIRTTEYQS